MGLTHCYKTTVFFYIYTDDWLTDWLVQVTELLTIDNDRVSWVLTIVWSNNWIDWLS